MNVDSRNGRNDVPLEWVKQQLRALSAVEPPRGLRERLLAAVPARAANEASQWQARRWPGATGWASIAAAIVVLCGALWLRPPAGPSAKPSPDANSGPGWVLAADYNMDDVADLVHLSGPGWVLAADYNSLRPPDINALDSNGLE